MKSKSTLAATFAFALLLSPLAGAAPADKGQDAANEGKPAVQPHNHAQEKTGAPLKAAEKSPDEQTRSAEHSAMQKMPLHDHGKFHKGL